MPYLEHPPFQLLEINIISAQDLAPMTRSMRSYAVAWVNPGRKLITRIDNHGHTDPSWNDKFVFRVDESFLRSDTSAIMIEIFAVSWFKDVHIGTVRVLIGTVLPPPVRPFSSVSAGTRFVALQVRRPSGRPQGILNIGLAVLDSSMRSMPLYTHLSTSAVGYRDLMGSSDTHSVQTRPPLRRSKSEFRLDADSTVDGSEFAAGKANGTVATSVWSDAELVPPPPPPDVPGVEEFFPAEVGSSVLEDWSVDGTSDGGKETLRSKLERWRTELPPIYDHGMGSFKSSAAGHTRRKTDGGGGLFSCFSDKVSYGCECSFFCGLPPRKKPAEGKAILSPSESLMLP